MAYTIKLGTFTKLENSTAQPVTTGWAQYDIVFKEGAELSNPTITLQVDLATIAPFNYAELNSKYYWIMSRTMLRNGYCVIDLKIDVLASYKTEIGAATLYVLRAAAAANGTIRDNFYPITAYSQTSISYQDAGTVPQGFNSGVYVINISGTNTGASTLLQLTPANFKVLLTNLYTAINGFQLTDVIAEVVKRWGGNPQTLINGAMWFPYAFPANVTPQNIKIGAWDSGVQGSIIEDPQLTLATISYSLGKHPQAPTRGDYLNIAPYARYELCVPGAGVVSLDTTKLVDQTGIRIYRKMDAFSGQMIVSVTGNPADYVIAYLTSQIGIPINLKSGSSGIIESGVNALASTALAAITGSPAAIAGAVTAGIGAAAEAHGGVPTSTNMSAGCASIMYEQGWLSDTFYFVTDADNTEHGRPLCENRQISTLSGFIQVSEGYVPIPGPLPEQMEVKRLLEAGFFYE